MPEQMSGLNPTWEDQQWYEQQKEKERAQQAQQFTGQTGIIGETLMGLGGYLGNAFSENSDHPIARMARDMLGGIGHADYMAKTQAETMHGETGRQFLEAVEIADTAVGLGAPRLIRNAPGLLQDAARAGAQDIQSLGVGQATMQAAQGLVDRIPPMPPIGPQVQLAGIPNRNFVIPQQMGSMQPTVMKAVTTTNPEILGGVRGGIRTGADLTLPDQSKQLIKRSKIVEDKKLAIARHNEQLEALEELKNDPDNLKIYLDANPEVKDIYDRKNGNMKRTLNSIRERKSGAQEALSQAQSNVLPFDKEGPNQSFFRTTQALNEKKLEESARAVKGYLEQHHLFPKGVSAAFFDAMDRLVASGKAEIDDLIAMAEYAANQGRRTGDVRQNLLNMAKDPHNELHTILRDQGAEIPKSAIENMLKDVKDVDDLMARWTEVLAGDVAYNMDTAKIWEPLDNLLKEIQSKP